MVRKRKKYRKFTDEEAAKEIEKLRKELADTSVRRTASQWAMLRGKLGGLLGRNSPGRSIGGKRGSASRWNKQNEDTAD